MPNPDVTTPKTSGRAIEGETYSIQPISLQEKSLQALDSPIIVPLAPIIEEGSSSTPNPLKSMSLVKEQEVDHCELTCL